MFVEAPHKTLMVGYPRSRWGRKTYYKPPDNWDAAELGKPPPVLPCLKHSPKAKESLLNPQFSDVNWLPWFDWSAFSPAEKGDKKEMQAWFIYRCWQYFFAPDALAANNQFDLPDDLRWVAWEKAAARKKREMGRGGQRGVYVPETQAFFPEEEDEGYEDDIGGQPGAGSPPRTPMPPPPRPVRRGGASRPVARRRRNDSAGSSGPAPRRRRLQDGMSSQDLERNDDLQDMDPNMSGGRGIRPSEELRDGFRSMFGRGRTSTSSRATTDRDTHLPNDNQQAWQGDDDAGYDNDADCPAALHQNMFHQQPEWIDPSAHNGLFVDEDEALDRAIRASQAPEARPPPGARSGEVGNGYSIDNEEANATAEEAENGFGYRPPFVESVEGDNSLD